MKQVDLTIIIVGWKVKNYLKECLSSIYAENLKNSFEVIVVDNSSCDNTVEMVVEDFPQANIISNLRNRGFASACNQGIKQAQGRYVLLLNPDTIVLNNALDKIVDYMDKNTQAGIAGCQLLNGDDSVQPSVRRFPKFTDHLIMMFKLHHIIKLKSYLMMDFDYQKEQEVDQVMGAFFMIRKEVIDKIGLLDKKYRAWFEEVDYCFRAKKAGFKVLYTPICQIIHFGGQSFARSFRIRSQWTFCKSRLRFIKKNRNWLSFIIVLLLTPFSLFFSLIYSIISPKNV